MTRFDAVTALLLGLSIGANAALVAAWRWHYKHYRPPF